MLVEKHANCRTYGGSPEQVQETENFNGQADDGVPGENEEESHGKNDRSPEL